MSPMRGSAPASCVGFILVKDGAFLTEKRRMDDDTDPGMVEIPGGHVEDLESLDDALVRECLEELGIVPTEYKHLCRKLHKATSEMQNIDYYVVTGWSGSVVGTEAESYKWLMFKQIGELDLPVDRDAVALAIKTVSE